MKGITESKGEKWDLPKEKPPTPDPELVALRAVNESLKIQRDNLLKDLGKIKNILSVPAGNRRLMQIAQPARECLNIIKPWLDEG
jgi:hypothetical protein